MENHELCHHGIKGMKWGVRRTAAQLGHKVKQHRTKKKRTAALEKARAAKAEQAANAKKPKKLADMTDDEIRTAINRLNMERQYTQLMNELHPQEVSKAKKYVNKFLDEAIVPALNETAKGLMKEVMSDTAFKALGIEKKPDYTKLRNEAEAKRTIAQVEDYFNNRGKEDYSARKTKAEAEKAEAEARMKAAQVEDFLANRAKKAAEAASKNVNTQSYNSTDEILALPAPKKQKKKKK